ncbi:MAG TPA: carboxypeptidase regulatory-like domain-containing protein, partial [Gemmatimonadaceae bacterium]|nr:carboxypeptidase regulatory-like domain-containing protein [Gemmatimonadaceae bacterium]
MMTSPRVLVAALASILAIAAAGAQDASNAPNLTGTVQTVAGTPIAGVEVRIQGSSLTARSDTRGRFSFVKAPTGPQLLMFRLVGYLPTTAEMRVPTKDADPVTMLQLPHNLDTVRVVASVNILAGVVVDDKDRPIPGATVDMLSGANSSTTTDSSGWFTFRSVRDGTVLVRARKLGFTPATTSLALGDWRGIVIHMEPLDYNLKGADLENASGLGNVAAFTWTETKQRITTRGMHAIIVPREELAPFDDYPLDQAIKRTKTGSAEAADLNSAGGDICVLLNGKNTVGPSTLANFRTSDVEFVELYPPGTETSGSAARYLRSSGCRRVQAPSVFSS